MRLSTWLVVGAIVAMLALADQSTPSVSAGVSTSQADPVAASLAGQGSVSGCVPVRGGMTVTASLVDHAERIGRNLHDLIGVKDDQVTYATFQRYRDRLKARVLLPVWRAFYNPVAGLKTDVTVTKIRAEQQQAVTQATLQCAIQMRTLLDCLEQNGSVPEPATVSASNRPALSGAKLAADALRQAGFPEGEIPMGVAVAKFESGFNPDPPHPPVVAGFAMHGMWQLNSRYWKDADWRDPYVNARMAFRVWKDAGKSWSPWSTWRTARASLKGRTTAPTNPPAPPVDCSATGVTAPAGAVRGGGPVPASFDQQGNPRTVEQAIAAITAAAPGGFPGEPVQGRCERYMNLAYGLGGGFGTALAHWNAPGPRSTTGIPPRGSLAFFRTGNPAGHVVLSLGGGMVISTDYNSRTHQYQAGMVSAGPIEDIEKWGPLLGWRPPSFRVSA